MSYQLKGIEIQLQGLRNQVRSARLELLGRPTTPQVDDPKTPRFYANLQAIGDRIEIAMRNLKSMEHLHGMRAQGLHHLPRDGRYRERQSMDAQLDNIAKVRALAFDVAVELRAAYGDAMSPTAADILKGARKVLQEMGKTVDQVTLHSTVQSVNEGRAFVSAAAPRAGPAMTAVDLLSQAWLLLACIVALTRTRTT
jgi:hypothetical protein